MAASDAAYGAVMRPVEGTILTVIREASTAAAARRRRRRPLVGVLDAARASGARRAGPHARAAAGAGQGRGGRRRRHRAPAAARRGAVTSSTAGRCPSPRRATASSTPTWPRRWRPPTPSRSATHGDGGIADLRYEVMYFLEAPDETIPAFKDVLGRHRRLDRRRRRRRPVELPHPHRRHRRRHRGGHRLRPSPRHPRHRPARAGRGGALGARGRRPSRRAVDVQRAGRDGGGRGRDRRRHPPDLPLARRAAHRDRRPDDEPVDRAAARGGRSRRRPTRS